MLKQEAESGFLIRTIQIKVEKDRLQYINSLIAEDDDDQLSDLDDHVMKVLKQSEGGFVQAVKEEILTVFEKFHKIFRNKNVSKVNSYLVLIHFL